MVCVCVCVDTKRVSIGPDFLLGSVEIPSGAPYVIIQKDGDSLICFGSGILRDLYCFFSLEKGKPF